MVDRSPKGFKDFLLRNVIAFFVGKERKSKKDVYDTDKIDFETLLPRQSQIAAEGCAGLFVELPEEFYLFVNEAAEVFRIVFFS